MLPRSSATTTGTADNQRSPQRRCSGAQEERPDSIFHPFMTFDLPPSWRSSRPVARLIPPLIPSDPLTLTSATCPTLHYSPLILPRPYLPSVVLVPHRQPLACPSPACLPAACPIPPLTLPHCSPRPASLPCLPLIPIYPTCD